MRGTAAKRDTPERSIIAAAEALGAVVLQVSGVGLPDTLVCHEGRTFLVEVKRPGKPLTEAQALTFARIHLSGVPVYVVECAEDMRLMLAEPGVHDAFLRWSPGSRGVEGQTKREHRPGHSRMRTLAEQCMTEGCARSRLPGLTTCAMCAGKGEE
jgi:hypothetical protein